MIQGITPELARLVLQASIALAMLSVGLHGRLADLFYVGPRPGLFFRAMAAVYVVVPLAAFLLFMVFHVPRPERAGIMIMAVSPLAPFVLGRLLAKGVDRSYVIGVYSALILASILLVPTSVAFVAALGNRNYEMPVGTVAWLVGVTMLLPLVAGLLLASVAPSLAERAAPFASALGYVLLLPLLLLILSHSGGELLALLGDRALLVILLTILAGYAGGYWLGGPVPEHRAALAQAAAARHPAIAILIADTLFADRRVMLGILLFMFAGILVSALRWLWIGRGRRRARIEGAAGSEIRAEALGGAADPL